VDDSCSLKAGRPDSFDSAQDELARLLLCAQQSERGLTLKMPKIKIFIDTFLSGCANYRMKAKPLTTLSCPLNCLI